MSLENNLKEKENKIVEIKEVIIRKDKNNYEVIDTKTYIDNDESLDEKFGY